MKINEVIQSTDAGYRIHGCKNLSVDQLAQLRDMINQELKSKDPNQTGRAHRNRSIKRPLVN